MSHRIDEGMQLNAAKVTFVKRSLQGMSTDGGKEVFE